MAVDEAGKSVFLLHHHRSNRVITLVSFHRDTIDSNHFESGLRDHGPVSTDTAFESVSGLFLQNNWLYIIARPEREHKHQLMVFKLTEEHPVTVSRNHSIETSACTAIMHPDNQHLFLPEEKSLKVMSLDSQGAFSSSSETSVLDLELEPAESILAGDISKNGLLLVMGTSEGRILLFSLAKACALTEIGQIQRQTPSGRENYNIRIRDDLAVLYVNEGKQGMVEIDLRGKDGNLSTDTSFGFENASTELAESILEATSGIGEQE